MIQEFHLYLYGHDRGPLATSFESSMQRLEELPKLHAEPDGSFVWARSGGTEQVYGMLYDAGGLVQYCDMRGKCQRQTFRLLCEAVSGSDQFHRLETMCLPDSVWQDFQSFERLAWGQSDH